jgi:hypothetical protein
MVLALMIAGAWLRLRGLSHMEFKRDEYEALKLGMQLLADHPWSSQAPWPATGMPSSNHIGNAPLFTWLVAAGWAWFADPLAITRVVAVVNVLCLYPLWLWARRRMGETPALFTLAIAAVSPFGVFFSRKVWGQDLLCIGVILVLWGIEWMRGPRPWRGVTLLALAGLVMGQLHQSGPIALALLPIAFGIQALADRKQGFRWSWSRPTPLELTAVAAAVALALFFWLPYADYLWHLPAATWGLRPKLPSMSPDLFVRVANQVIPADLFYFFRPDRDDFIAGVFRRFSFQAATGFGGTLLVYGVWRWLRAPHALPVLGYWWLLVIAVFAIARIPSYPFYVLALMPLPTVLASGAFDGALPRLHAQALLACRLGYVVSLLCLTVATQSWLFTRGGATGDYGPAYSVRLAQARAVLAFDRGDTDSAFETRARLTDAEASLLECRRMSVELRWLANWLDGRPAAEIPAIVTEGPRVCSGFVGGEGSQLYRWYLQPQ